MRLTRALTLATILTALSTGAAAQQAPPPSQSKLPDDPFQWLEDVESPKALEWVEARNRTTLEDLQRMPAFDSLYGRVLAILTSRDRIAYPDMQGGYFYNFWQDAQHERGIWRRTSPQSYFSGTPVWETVLDIDSLAAAENVNWAYGGASCLYPQFRQCLVRLSRGGSDASESREFDTKAKTFVRGGFFIPHAKTNASWKDENTLLVGTDFGPGSMTTSGYARVVKQWRRGTPLSSARTRFEGKPSDVSVGTGSFIVNGRRISTLSHSPVFFESTRYVIQGDSLIRIDIPKDAGFQTVGSQFIVYLRAEWAVAGTTYPQGALIGIDYDAFMRGDRAFQTIIAPSGRQTIEGWTVTQNHLLVNTLNNVRGELHRFRLQNGKWVGAKVAAPDFGTIGIAGTSRTTDRYFFTYTSFTQPTTLYVAEPDGAVRVVRQMPKMFDDTGLTLQQHEATSKDGTKIPYFVIHRESMKLDGTNPTLLYGYGGYQISQKPGYNPTVGATWLERGGVYVVANIRGGGEFGPAWHRSAQKENKQRSYDDFIAVAEDLIARRVSSPAQLGISGGSNGGLLVGAVMTQRPELFNAVVVNVPLLDMQRYHKLLAGASWMAEYGDPDKPEEWSYISKYSPYQNVFADRKYPRALFTTTTRDDRVHPGHARKMAAKMESLGMPIYYFENTEGGHGAGTTPAQRAKMSAVTYSYLIKQLMTKPLM
ncbi:MAG: prolyl oligopeptidase family serine peptidase [Gemmatimonadaceae bacterium]